LTKNKLPNEAAKKRGKTLKEQKTMCNGTEQGDVGEE
jgi:hypothetical protein